MKKGQKTGRKSRDAKGKEVRTSEKKGTLECL